MFLARVLGYGKLGIPGLLSRAAERSGQQCVASGKAGQVCVYRYTYAYLCIHELLCSHGPWPATPLCPWDRLPGIALWAPGSAGAGHVVGSGLQQTDFMSVFLQHLSIKGNII